MQWYYADASGAQVGPFDVQQLKSAYESRSLTEDNLVWNNGMPEWSKLGSLPQLLSQLNDSRTRSDGGLNCTRPGTVSLARMPYEESALPAADSSTERATKNAEPPVGLQQPYVAGRAEWRRFGVWHVVHVEVGQVSP